MFNQQAKREDGGSGLSEQETSPHDPRSFRRMRPAAPNPNPNLDGLSNHYNDHMTIEMTATEAKAKFLALLDQVAAGEEVSITKHGRTVARLVPSRGRHGRPGWLADVAVGTSDEEGLFSTGVPWVLS